MPRFSFRSPCFAELLEGRRMLVAGTWPPTGYGFSTANDDRVQTFLVDISGTLFFEVFHEDRSSGTDYTSTFYNASVFDSLVISTANDADSIDCRNLGIPYTLNGGSGNDTIAGSTEADVINGDADQDSIEGEGGNDSINGGTQSDTLLGEGGADTCVGAGGVELIQGGSGNDKLYGDADGDSMLGESGDDELFGGDGNDTLNGGSNNDTVRGEGNSDQLDGSDGNDVLRAVDPNLADVTIVGGLGTDTAYYDDPEDSGILSGIETPIGS